MKLSCEWGSDDECFAFYFILRTDKPSKNLTSPLTRALFIQLMLIKTILFVPCVSEYAIVRLSKSIRLSTAWIYSNAFEFDVSFVHHFTRTEFKQILIDLCFHCIRFGWFCFPSIHEMWNKRESPSNRLKLKLWWRIECMSFNDKQTCWNRENVNFNVKNGRNAFE